MNFQLSIRKQKKDRSVDLGTLELGDMAVGAVTGALYIKLEGDQALHYTEDGFERVVPARGKKVCPVLRADIVLTYR